MKIAMCDDDKILTSIYSKYIRDWGKDHNESIEIAEFPSAEAFLYHWSPMEKFDILFLDIQMESMNGMELAKVIRSIDKTLPIVFITGCKDYVFEGYNVGALNYLIKPVSEASLRKSLDWVRDQVTLDDSLSIIVQTDGRIQKIHFDNIYHFESQGHYIIIHTKQGDVKFKKTITELAQEVDNSCFCRVQRSFIVNLKYVNSIASKSLTLENGTTLSIGAGYWHPLNEAFIRYHRDVL